jgi:hypothetical protein
MNKNLTVRKRRSEPLTKDEHRAFIKSYRSFPTKVDAEFFFGIKYQVLDLVSIKGTGSPDTIAAIRNKIAA